ncbi:hypothetical protein AB0C33_17220 [Nonomuraea sp. NPDC048881]|uniref:hypothetical protein n=1 Tax=Nonomuraea sp. NPDC048881 TaxID=3155030 RepID=UPI00340D9AF3
MTTSSVYGRVRAVLVASACSATSVIASWATWNRVIPLAPRRRLISEILGDLAI